MPSLSDAQVGARRGLELPAGTAGSPPDGLLTAGIVLPQSGIVARLIAGAAAARYVT